MYKFWDTETEEGWEARYWNCRGTNICVVASVTKGIDWAAYVEADQSYTEEEALEGCKLTENDARYFFPDIKLWYRR